MPRHGAVFLSYCIATEPRFDPGLENKTAGQWCDGVEYQKWLASMIGDTETIEVEYKLLTLEALDKEANHPLDFSSVQLAIAENDAALYSQLNDGGWVGIFLKYP